MFPIVLNPIILFLQGTLENDANFPLTLGYKSKFVLETISFYAIPLDNEQTNLLFFDEGH